MTLASLLLSVYIYNVFKPAVNIQIFFSVEMYIKAKAKLHLAVAGEFVVPYSTNHEGRKTGKGKRVKQRSNDSQKL
jgi:hypothetical protein